RDSLPLKASASNAGDPGSIPGSGRSPGEGNGNPLQVSLIIAFPWCTLTTWLPYTLSIPPEEKGKMDSLINLQIQKENPKVVNEIIIEDFCLPKAAYCRCWRSKTFLACDGSHSKHSELTGSDMCSRILKKKGL
uniref:CDGSH iron-sulfur domain-containing protein 2 n=1 Tax=Moschus moschiferus TaxID=68415 RepID=A0A8C6G2I1_MOSMO